MILGDKRLSQSAAHETWIARHPLPWLKEMISSNFDIGRSKSRRPAPEHHRLPGCFQKIVGNLERTILVAPYPATHRMSVRARTEQRAVKVGEVRFHHCDVAGAVHRDSVLGFIVHGSV